MNKKMVNIYTNSKFLMPNSFKGLDWSRMTYIEDDECNHYSNVLPSVVVEDIESGTEELVGRSQGAETTVCNGIWILEIAT